ncbi:MAG: hypothetical protein ACOCVN_01610 [bacterium]
MHFEVEPLNGKRWPLTDFGWVSYPLDPSSNAKNSNEDWGMKLTSIGNEQDKGQVKEHPLENWDDFEKYPWPDYSNPNRYLKN